MERYFIGKSNSMKFIDRVQKDIFHSKGERYETKRENADDMKQRGETRTIWNKKGKRGRYEREMEKRGRLLTQQSVFVLEFQITFLQACKEGRKEASKEK